MFRLQVTISIQLMTIIMHVIYDIYVIARSYVVSGLWLFFDDRS